MDNERITYLHVAASNIAPGDEFFYTFGRKPNRDWDGARATVIAVNPESKTMTVERADLHTQHDIPLLGYKDVIGGPKLAAANSNRKLVQRGGYGHWWVGDMAVKVEVR